MGGLWDYFRSSRLWRALRRVTLFRSCLYFLIELRRTWMSPATVDSDFERASDPWNYETNPLELDRFRRQLALLTSVGEDFGRTLEIGCAEGRFTESLEPLSGELVVLDLSIVALERAKARKTWGTNVSFGQADLRFDPIGRDFDLIVVTGVLEYFPKGKTLRQVITKLAAALAPGGYLLVETTRAAQPAEEAWWWRLMPRGRRINEMAGQEASLREVASDVTVDFCMTLYRKRS